MDALKYQDFQPTVFDPTGLGLPRQQDWLVVPVMVTRDSGPLDKSNFKAALELLGGESKTVEVHRFNHWGPGWFEIILVNPSSKERMKQLEYIIRALADYPVLDDEDFYQMEHDDWLDSWQSIASGEFRRQLLDRLWELETLIDSCSDERLRKLWEKLGGTYEHESGGCSWRHPKVDIAQLLSLLEELIDEDRQEDAEGGAPGS